VIERDFAGTPGCHSASDTMALFKDRNVSNAMQRSCEGQS
jgi:hypothetical protein